MNRYLQNLNRLEFLITLACTGRCRHCSQGEHAAGGGHIDGEAAARAVRQLCEKTAIRSLMTFGGEPLLYPEEVFKVHTAARQMNIPSRQLITNGFFSRDIQKIKEVAKGLAESGVNAVLLSVDAFHQESIPLQPVKAFAGAVKAEGILLKAHPAWLKGEKAQNPYDQRTAEILREFEEMGIPASEGNLIFLSGNALSYLSEYFEGEKAPANPYEQDPSDIRSLCVSPDGSLLGGNICKDSILEIIEGYLPPKGQEGF
ncbi:MAG: radical SAM protein [Provencibacterium sp.]|jgi:MoaA/NifB/PqqE/SkfB family radical SAM enzyme|nr:radical SAM protein [Provencibacterium sp.]